MIISISCMSLGSDGYLVEGKMKNLIRGTIRGESWDTFKEGEINKDKAELKNKWIDMVVLCMRVLDKYSSKRKK